LYAGINDNAGEVGHIRLSDKGPAGFGKTGSFEGFCSGGGLAQLGYTMALEKYQMGICPSYFDPEAAPGHITAKTLAVAAEQGDETAREVYEVCGEYLGKGLAILIDILNPECIVIGSIFARSHDLIWPSAQKVLEREALRCSFARCKVVPAALGEQIGDYAALMTAVYHEQE
jgi:glucokinase